MSAIVAAGHRPVFIDVDPQILDDGSEVLGSRARNIFRVVAVHLFGQMADMPALLTVAAEMFPSSKMLRMHRSAT